MVKILAVASLLAALGMAHVGRAHAEPRLVITGCDAVEISGASYQRYSFEVRLSPADSILYVWRILFVPAGFGQPGDTCVAMVATGPTGWFGGVRDDFDGGAAWGTNHQEDAVYPGETLGGFQVVLSHPTCCFDAYFLDNFFERYGHEVMCFACPLPVPASNSTWGSLKSRYR